MHCIWNSWKNLHLTVTYVVYMNTYDASKYVMIDYKMYLPYCFLEVLKYYPQFKSCSDLVYTVIDRCNFSFLLMLVSMSFVYKCSFSLNASGLRSIKSPEIYLLPCQPGFRYQYTMFIIVWMWCWLWDTFQSVVFLLSVGIVFFNKVY